MIRIRDVDSKADIIISVYYQLSTSNVSQMNYSIGKGENLRISCSHPYGRLLLPDIIWDDHIAMTSQTGKFLK